MKVLDLFCGAGGASMGYSRSGFTPYGVDHYFQPNYPFSYRRIDVFTFLGTENIEEFDLIHASPPCQGYSRGSGLAPVKKKYPKLIPQIREALIATGKPYVIENVEDAPLIDSVRLCGTAFGLGYYDWELQRHRLFESNLALIGTYCVHSSLPAISVVGGGVPFNQRRRLGRVPLIHEKRAAMGIDWMNRNELSEAIPPIYTQYLGDQIRALL